MGSTTLTKLTNSLHDTLKARDFDMSKYDDSYLELEITLAIGAINRCRRFVPTNTSLYDPKYEYLIVPLCIESISKIGAEGESKHVENGITREYESKLLSQIIPLIK